VHYLEFLGICKVGGAQGKARESGSHRIVPAFILAIPPFLHLIERNLRTRFRAHKDGTVEHVPYDFLNRRTTLAFA
jgi:hypothetical protein